MQESVERMGFVQLDSINVVERAHHLTLASRLDDYRREHLTPLLEENRSLFEHWTHDASAIPTRWFQHWKPRFARNGERIRRSAWWQSRFDSEPDLILDHVRGRIGREGALRAADFEHERRGDAAGWWAWKPQKAALEFLWQTGELIVVRRVNFHKSMTLPSACCRISTAREIADFWQSISPAQAASWCERAAKDDRVRSVFVGSIDGTPAREAYAVADWERRLSEAPAAPERMRLICPFDPVLRDRRRARRLFDFDYRFEAFMPEAKRRYGYYVLPVLEGERLVGRIDPKFRRDRGVLEVRRIFWEPGVEVTRVRTRELAAAVERLARTIGADRVELPAVA